VLDFTSALYLGLRHGHAELEPWPALTAGAPAALVPPPGEQEVARSLSTLVGCDRAVLAPSTLHLFSDVFDVWPASRLHLCIDSGVYPIASWGTARARLAGAVAERFAHFDPNSLRRAARRARRAGRTPVVVTDGLCLASGRVAPLPEYVDAVEAHGGYVVVDDTQALGVLGSSPSARAPYGLGGGGTKQVHGVCSDRVVLASSLAKGFGAPLAALAGPAEFVRRFVAASKTRVNCGPPSAAAIAAACRALAVNRATGDRLRQRLTSLVRQFRLGLARAGLRLSGGILPVQSLVWPYSSAALRFHDALLRHGVAAVAHRRNGSARVSFLIRADHTACEIDEAVLRTTWAIRVVRARDRKEECCA